MMYTCALARYQISTVTITAAVRVAVGYPNTTHPKAAVEVGVSLEGYHLCWELTNVLHRLVACARIVHLYWEQRKLDGGRGIASIR